MILYSETELKPQSGVRDAFRDLFGMIDKAIFGLLSIVFQLFFSIASADIFSSGVITKFFGRVQLIIGVFMMFQLAMTILKGIVNPDGFMDSKTGGGNIVIRICTALVMLALIVPINIPSASNEYEKQINNNGLLFGTLYSLQYRILNNNTIGKVVMGVGDSKDKSDNLLLNNGNEGFKKASNIFVSTIVKGFYRINLIPEEDRKTPAGKEDDQVNANRVCKDIDQSIINEYKKVDADYSAIIDFTNETCDIDSSLDGSVEKKSGVWAWLTRKVRTGDGSAKLYAFTYMPVVSSVMGVIFVIIMLSFCIDVATRAIKLAILRLLAPVPIISYMDPKGGKDGAFGAWTKAIASTYLDLFIRVASVYFVIYMIQEMLAHGIATSSTGALKRFTILFIWIALFFFAKEAPKFIKQVLGMKDDGGGGMFGGIGKVLGVGAAGAGAVSGLVSGTAAGVMSGKGLGKIGKGIAGGVTGAIGGGVNAGRDLWKQDKPNASAIMANNRARAEKRYANAADASTAHGRFIAAVESDVGIRNSLQRQEAKASSYDAAGAAWKRLDSALDNVESVKNAKDHLEAVMAMGKSEAEINEARRAVGTAKKYAYEDIVKMSKDDLKNASAEEQIAHEAAVQQLELAKRRNKNDTRDQQVFGVYGNVTDIANTTLDMAKNSGKAASPMAEAIRGSGKYNTAKANAKRAADSKK